MHSFIIDSVIDIITLDSEKLNREIYKTHKTKLILYTQTVISILERKTMGTIHI